MVKVGDIVIFEKEWYEKEKYIVVSLVTHLGSIYGIGKKNFGKTQHVLLENLTVVGEFPLSEEAYSEIRVGPGYNLANKLDDGYPPLRMCMEAPYGFYRGYENNRYIFSGYMFQDALGFMEEWNKTYPSMQYNILRSCALTIVAVKAWHTIIYAPVENDQTPLIYYGSVDLKNKWKSRHVAKLMAVFLRTFFFNEAGQYTSRKENESYIDYMLKATNLRMGDMHYFWLHLERSFIDKINSLGEIPYMDKMDAQSQTKILTKLIGK